MSSKESCPVVNIPCNLGKRHGITAAWFTEDKISVTAYSNQLLQSVNNRPPVNAPVKVTHLAPTFILDEPILRSLVSECSNVFLNLQVVKSSSPAASIDYLKISRTYRSAIRACLEKLEDLITNTKPRDLEQYQNYVTIFYSVEYIWHLVEILIVDSNSATAVVPNLLEWVQYHFPTANRMATELLQQGRDVDSNEEYWGVVKGLIIQGQIQVARALLRLHTKSEMVCFEVAEQILQTMPIYSAYGGLSVPKFKSQWQYWSANARSKIDAGILAAEPDLEEIVKLVVGDRQTWTEQCRYATSWFEYFPGYLFYTESTCKYYELGTFANTWLSQCISTGGMNATYKYLDKIILSVMENNLPQVLHNIQNICDNKWFLTHLVDLLYHCGQLTLSTGGTEDQDAEKLFRESLLYDFGTLLMSRNASLWEVGLDYLEFSSTEGLGAREALLARIPIRNEKQALKLISAAKKNNFPAVESEICKVLVKRNLANRLYGNALEWAIRSRDSFYVTAVANIFLEHYCNTGEIMCEDVIANVGAKMFCSPRLIFLVKYYDFRQFYRERSFAQAAELLINLLDSKITPSYFWPSLLADTIPLLEFKEPVIPTKETYTILHHLEWDLVPMIEKRKEQLKGAKTAAQQQQGQSQSQQMDTDEGDDNNQTLNAKFAPNLLNNCTDDLVKLLRLACTRNLARAFIIENTVAD
ncbi:nuclear pore complex protein Nup75 [Culex quinquefasciatus]|uniref:nuclear pore complex protein Nup75 n=1 Tax=Culex quinquefasciatus TaxID=7176 RepID=UPI0018E2C45A|nr:nuclear pore complex protein Nup75 [Culex quinquefasciatus]XP_039434508.1 nuclear pore complex protein Nup75 [Culex pipiens pallens]